MPLLSATALLCVALAGCEPTIDDEAAAEYVDGWAEGAADQLKQRAALAQASVALEKEFEEGIEDRRRDPEATGLSYIELAEDVYRDRDFEPALFGEEDLTEVGEAVLAAIEGVDDHALDPDPYGIEEIELALSTWEDRLTSVDDFDGLEPTPEELEVIKGWLSERPVDDFELDDSYEALTDAIVDGDIDAGRLVDALDDYREKRGAIAEVSAAIERRLATGLARYADEQRHFRTKEIFVHPRNWDYYNEPDVENSGARPDPAKGAFRAREIWRDAAHLTEEIQEENELELRQDRIRETVREVYDAEEPDERIAEIPPQQPQYWGLVEELHRYRDIVDDGGWEQVDRNNHIRPGSTSETVGELKRRLRAEGYFPDDVDIDDTWGDELTAAIEEYQKTHQMHVDGRPDHVFWYSLNIPAERRMAQIELNLDRWRETNIDHDEQTYAVVNIPDFTVELWHEQQREMRMATIVGDNKKERNPLTDETDYINRTPTPMAAYIDRVIFNPYWNVTDRIRAQRILPDVRESIEHKYALKFEYLDRQLKAGNEVDPLITRGEIASSIPLEDEKADEPEETASLGLGRLGMADRGGADDGADDASDAESDGESADRGGGPALDEMTEEEREELRAERVSEMTQRGLQRWTHMGTVYNEELERDVEARIFDLQAIEQLESRLVDGSEDRERFRGQFTYLNREDGHVDVESTDPDDIPSWYAANNYEVVHPGHDTWEYVRMLPGPENSLGFVKIIFPNYDNIYLHDTPEKGLFNSQVRGYSHGCIRLEKPFELSRAILDRGGTDDPVDIDQILASEEYVPIFLNRQIPIYLEYYTVRVDDEGRANFLADIYDYDDEELDEAS